MNAIEQTITFNHDLALTFCHVPSGAFTRGERTVTLSKDFWMSKFPITQRQWTTVMGFNPSVFKAAGLSSPVETVSWDDVHRFLSLAGSGLRLPSEAEWEYACRGETATDYNVPGKSLGELGWFLLNSGTTTHPVGSKLPNTHGIHDCHGNVWEWCADWVGDYPDHDVLDPIGPDHGTLRVFRGGCWASEPWGCRSTTRYGSEPTYRDYSVGFRPVFSSHTCP